MKYLKRVISSICILAMIFCMFSGCSDSGSGGGGDSGGSYSQRAKDPMNDEIVISYIPMSTAQENTPIIEAAFKEAFSIYDNITINTYDAQFDPNTQITLINEAITPVSYTHLSPYRMFSMEIRKRWYTGSISPKSRMPSGDRSTPLFVLTKSAAPTCSSRSRIQLLMAGWLIYIFFAVFEILWQRATFKKISIC